MVTKKACNIMGAKQSFQDLWVSGTLGAFFVALVTNIPVHLLSMEWRQDGLYAMDILIRYMYLIWLLCYFFISNLKNGQCKDMKPWDMSYDVMQSVLALSSAYFLGFFVPEHQYGLSAYAVTNATIFIICMLSLIWFHDDNWSNGINCIRLVGAFVSFPSMIFAIIACSVPHLSQALWVYLVFAAALVILWVILVIYIVIRVRQDAEA